MATFRVSRVVFRQPEALNFQSFLNTGAKRALGGDIEQNSTLFGGGLLYQKPINSVFPVVHDEPNRAHF